VYGGAVVGRSYVEWLRKGKICIAPVTREVVINGVRQPGDEDTTRTYELAAAHCFFIHRRTDFVKTLYSETDEVPMYDGPEELTERVLHYLARPAERERMAALAHRRAVPAYSVDSRADEIVAILRERAAQTSESVHSSRGESWGPSP
jgi:spore maturation protein CgeB